MKFIFVAMIMMLLAGCSTYSVRDSQLIQDDRKTLTWIANNRKAGEIKEALSEAKDFQKLHPSSVYFQAARLEEARALEDLGKIDEAELLYRDIRDKTLEREPALSAMAEWRLSFTAEAQGEDLRALAHVAGAERHAKDLPQEIGMVEIPARKALLLHRTGKADEAEKSVRDAERGLQKYLSTNLKPTDEWMARLYFEMGRSIAATPDAGNFENILQAQRVSQDDLLRSLHYGDPKVSPEVLEMLRTNYTNLWNSLKNITASSNNVVESRGRRNEQILLGVEFLKVLNEAQTHRPIVAPPNPWEKDIFALVDELSNQTHNLLYSTSESTVLTEESQVLNGLRRDFSKKPKNQEPNAQELPAKKVDPNL